jgi:transposase
MSEHLNNEIKRGNYNAPSQETRSNVIRMYNNGVSKTKIVIDLNVKRSTVNNIIEIYLKTGLNTIGTRGGAHNVKCTEEIRSFIEDLLNEECTRTLKYLKTRVYERFNVSLCLSAIKYNLKLINFSLKQVTAICERRNSPDVIEKRYYFALRYDELSGLYLRYQFIYIDEAGFCVSMRRNRGWSKKGDEQI